MKLFIFAAIIAVGEAARLEHLEQQQQQQQQQLRAYLPPYHGSNFGSSHGSFGSFGANSGAFGASGAGRPSFNAPGSFPNAFNQYLPPDQEENLLSAGSPQFAGSANGFGAQNGQQYGHQVASQGSNPFSPLANRPYSSQNIPQQPFDEKTGYHY